MTEVAAPIAERAQAAGIGLRHLHLATLKPFLVAAIAEAISDSKLGVVTVDNHLKRGGLGAAVAEVIADQGLAAQLSRVVFDDTFAAGGEKDYLFERFGIGPSAIVNAIESLLAAVEALWRRALWARAA